MTVAISCVNTFVGGYSPCIFQYACALFRAFAIKTRKSGPMPEYTTPILGQTTATFSIIESSIKIEDDFFSVAMTIPLEATEDDGPVICGKSKLIRTFNAKTRCSLRYRSKRMFDLNELATWREYCKGIANHKI